MAGQWEIKGKTCLITGGASGLGAKYAEAFLEEGAKAVAILDVAQEVGNQTAARLNKIYPNKVKFFKCDVSSETEITTVFNQVVDEYRQIDVIINNAGIMVDSPAMWRKACDVNWQGLVSLTMKGQKHMRKDDGGAGGTIINISSTAALFKLRYLPIYCGSKMAVLHFSQTLAEEPFFERSGVRILTICFGPTDTPLMQGLKDRSYDERTGEEFDQFAKEAHSSFQSSDSALKAFLTMFKEGANGSIWLSSTDKPVKDITPAISGIFKDLEKLIFGL